MRYGILFCVLAMLILHLLTPYWWWVMAVPFVFALVRARNILQGFGVGSISAGLLWFGAAIYYWIDGGGIIADRMAAMLQLDSALLLVLLTALAAFVAGGLAGMAGSAIRLVVVRD